MTADNASMEQLIQSIVRLVDRFVVCDLENDKYEFYNLNGQMIYKPLGFYHDFQMQILEKYKTLEPLEAIDILFPGYCTIFTFCSILRFLNFSNKKLLLNQIP